ncbi:MAG: carboxypeptidase regulatory-like domain-containing protein [Deltaproteobacteria bacterium]|nr:carboxypeptidase regulatory-like domain-containing protein [Deltaproteobacteria bacterium]
MFVQDDRGHAVPMADVELGTYPLASGSRDWLVPTLESSDDVTLEKVVAAFEFPAEVRRADRSGKLVVSVPDGAGLVARASGDQYGVLQDKGSREVTLRRPRRTISGVVRDNDQRPLGGAKVLAIGRSSRALSFAKTASTGAFEVHIDDDWAQLIVSAPGFATQTAWLGRPNYLPQRPTLLKKVYEVRGFVRTLADEVAPGVEVCIRERSNVPRGQGFTDRLGRFSIRTTADWGSIVAGARSMAGTSNFTSLDQGDRRILVILDTRLVDGVIELVDTRGRPTAGRQVLLEYHDGPQFEITHQERRAHTDSAGLARFRRLVHGATYEVKTSTTTTFVSVLGTTRRWRVVDDGREERRGHGRRATTAQRAGHVELSVSIRDEQGRAPSPIELRVHGSGGADWEAAELGRSEFRVRGEMDSHARLTVWRGGALAAVNWVRGESPDQVSLVIAAEPEERPLRRGSAVPEMDAPSPAFVGAGVTRVRVIDRTSKFPIPKPQARLVAPHGSHLDFVRRSGMDGRIEIPNPWFVSGSVELLAMGYAPRRISVAELERDIELARWVAIEGTVTRGGLSIASDVKISGNRAETSANGRFLASAVQGPAVVEVGTRRSKRGVLGESEETHRFEIDIPDHAFSLPIELPVHRGRLRLELPSVPGAPQLAMSVSATGVVELRPEAWDYDVHVCVYERSAPRKRGQPRWRLLANTSSRSLTIDEVPGGWAEVFVLLRRGVNLTLVAAGEGRVDESSMSELALNREWHTVEWFACDPSGR